MPFTPPVSKAIQIHWNPLMGVKGAHVNPLFSVPYTAIYTSLAAAAAPQHRRMSSPFILILSLILLMSVSVKSDEQLGEWCIADEQMPDDDLQRALDWACGPGGADCSQIQVNKPCYLPNTLKDHASYAFNSYYQKNKHKGAYCYFNSAAMITGRDPSHGGCKYEYAP